MSNIVIKDLGKGRFAIKGVCEWAKVFEPDTRFKETGVYSIDFPVDEEDIEALHETFDFLAEEKLAEVVKDKPALKKQASVAEFIKEIYDDDGDVVGHKIQIKQQAKVYSEKKEKWFEFPVRVVDAQNNEMDGSQLIGNGSTVVALFEPQGYFMASDKKVGVSLKGLRQVKVLDLVPFEAEDLLSDFEGDFVADNKGKPEPKAKEEGGTTDKAKGKAPPKKNKKEEEDADFDDDIPF